MMKHIGALAMIAASGVGGPARAQGTQQQSDDATVARCAYAVEALARQATTAADRSNITIVTMYFVGALADHHSPLEVKALIATAGTQIAASDLEKTATRCADGMSADVKIIQGK